MEDFFRSKEKKRKEKSTREMREKKLFRDRAYKENKEEREVWRSRREDIRGASRRARESAQSARHPRVAALILPGKIRREYRENIESYLFFASRVKKKEAFGSKTKEISLH